MPFPGLTPWKLHLKCAWLRKKKKKKPQIIFWHDCCDKLNCRNKTFSLYKLTAWQLRGKVGGSQRGRWLKVPKKIHLSYSSLQQLLWEVLWNSSLPALIPNDAATPTRLLLETWSSPVLPLVGALGPNNRVFSYTVISEQATVHPTLGRTRILQRGPEPFSEDHTQTIPPTPSSLRLNFLSDLRVFPREL